MKKKSVRGLAAVCTLILLLIFSVAAYADTPTATDELDAVQQYVDDNNITLEDKENGMPFYLRTAYVMDVAASKEGMADSKYLDRFNESYGDFERVYFMEYAYTYGASSMPYSYNIAIGVRADGTMETCPTFDDIRSRTYDINWCAGVVVENILDRTLAEAMAE
ncbi:MAG: hypothetical protein SOX90_07980 [Candidatus Fimadaptatus sp.]|nr:hypothetical protein [Candidatus Fimadaptatus sp.]